MLACGFGQVRPTGQRYQHASPKFSYGHVPIAYHEPTPLSYGRASSTVNQPRFILLGIHRDWSAKVLGLCVIMHTNAVRDTTQNVTPNSQ